MMEWEPFETFEHEGFQVELYTDYDAGNPYTEWDQASEILSDVKDYNLGGDVPHPEQAYSDTPASATMARWLTLFGGYAVAIPWYFADYGSSGARVWLHDPNDDPASGWLVMTIEVAKDCFEPIEDAEKCARSEFNAFRAWIEGEVIGYVVRAGNGDVIDSCWGYYGEIEYVRDEARRAAKDESDERKRLRALPWMGSLPVNFV